MFAFKFDIMVIFRYPIFACFVIFLIWLSYEIRKGSKKSDTLNQDFWDRENQANSVRKQNLDLVEYITIPYDTFPIDKYSDTELGSIEQELLSLKDKRILNMTGLTNTDIKLKYGPANLSAISEYDENFLSMAKLINSYGARLHELGYDDDAITVLEFGIISLTDISANYKLLAQLYVNKNQVDKIDFLIETALKLDSLMKKSIVNSLESIKNSPML